MLPPVDETHNPELTSWVNGADGHPEFPVQNLPFGIFSETDGERRAGVAIGDSVLDLRGLERANSNLLGMAPVLEQPTLNALLALPSDARLSLRRRLSRLLSDPHYRDRVEPHILEASACTMHIPAQIGDFTDFFAGIHHATNVGRVFRPDNPLLPNYRHVPIAYHGRVSSIRPSGVPVRRPHGQLKLPEQEQPIFAPCRRLDFELELGIWVGPGNEHGRPIPISAAWDHIAGFCLLNDWSARDIQVWESQPAGPFLGKNFHSTISPWVVTVEALAPFRRPFPARDAGDVEVLPYLEHSGDEIDGSIAIELEVTLLSDMMRERGDAPQSISRSDTSAMYWSFAQIVTHHASNGCNISPGDLIGSGTLSLPSPAGLGCLLEMTRGGAEPIILPTGETRAFLDDGDEVSFAAFARAEGRATIGFGGCRARIIPAG